MSEPNSVVDPVEAEHVVYERLGLWMVFRDSEGIGEKLFVDLQMWLFVEALVKRQHCS